MYNELSTYFTVATDWYRNVFMLVTGKNEDEINYF